MTTTKIANSVCGYISATIDSEGNTTPALFYDSKTKSMIPITREQEEHIEKVLEKWERDRNETS